MTKKRVGLIASGVAALAAIAASMGMVPSNPYQSPSKATQEQRAADNQRKQAVTDRIDVTTEDKASRLNSLAGHWKIQYRNPAGRFLNQRQYRKRCAQNPCLRKSKKHRSRN